MEAIGLNTELDINTELLDNEIKEILELQSVTGDQKWILYYRVLESKLYKKYPLLKPFQFHFVIEKDKTNDDEYHIRINRTKHILDQKKKCKKYIKLLSFCIAPCMSALVASIIKRCDS